MLAISRFTVEGLSQGCVTDEEKPKFSYTIESDSGDGVKEVILTVNGWKVTNPDQRAVRYDGAPLKPFTAYTAALTVKDEGGQATERQLVFETGRMQEPWKAQWISDADYHFTEKKVSPKPMVFRRVLAPDKKIRRAQIYATAMGVYQLTLDGRKLGTQYFAPGFTSYATSLQYQVYDVTDMLQAAKGRETVLTATVSGGWAVGSFVFTRVNRVSADRQALLLEIRIQYEDGTSQVIGTDSDWEVSEDGPVKMADLYDGETYDARVTPADMTWRKATKEQLRVSPRILAQYGAPVTAHEVFTPVSVTDNGTKTIYDFGQNFAGVVRLHIKRAAKGQEVIVRHAEILNPDGTLNTVFLRTAKATATYICVEGEQEYTPQFTYMGFRYISIEGISKEDVEASAVALYSDVAPNGEFSCSNELINRLQENIRWGSKSNFVDIPTDCPQRDERMGWTGDIAVFSPTACYNFDMGRFLHKWLRDVKAEQLPTGGIPNTVPVCGYGFPATMPKMAIDWWGDACVLVPWAEYQARGDRKLLEELYPTMKKYIKACKWWAGLLSFGKKRYIWDTPATLHFGDWIAPDVPKMSQWQHRAKWTATASLCNTSRVAALVAKELGYEEDYTYYKELQAQVADAYVSVFTDGQGKLMEEFQTGYVLPLYLHMFPTEELQKKAALNLAKLVEKNHYRIGTGFPGTPYILFALADNGRQEEAFRMLMNTECPSWLYEVKAGATTIWERWDGLDENGVCPIGDDGTDMMISYNHYASGAVGAFLYQRIAGIEPIEPAYKSFQIKPLVGGGLTWAKGAVDTPYGQIVSSWRLEEKKFQIDVKVPLGTTCRLCLPDGSTQQLPAGTYQKSCGLDNVLRP